MQQTGQGSKRGAQPVPYGRSLRHLVSKAAASPWRAFAMALFILVVMVAPPALAQTAGDGPVPAPDKHSQGRLSGQNGRIAGFDALLDGKHYGALGRELEREHAAGRGGLARRWQDRRLRDGGSAYLGFVYSRELMRAAVTGAGRQKARMREQAAFVAIYTMAVLTIDGPRCADVSAPGARSEQLFDLAAEAFSWAAALPEARRDRIIDAALALERETAPLRRDDDFICLGGAEDIARALRDPQTRVEARDDGRQEVTPGTQVAAEFADLAASRPLQALARRTIRADLCRMLDQMRI